jgi:hypothetical protein
MKALRWMTLVFLLGLSGAQVFAACAPPVAPKTPAAGAQTSAAQAERMLSQWKAAVSKYVGCAMSEHSAMPDGPAKNAVWTKAYEFGKTADEVSNRLTRLVAQARAREAPPSVAQATPIPKANVVAAKPSGAKRKATESKCLKLGISTGPQNAATYFQLTNQCGERMVVFYCLINNKPVDMEREGASGYDCRVEKHQRIVEMGTYTYARAPTTRAAYDELSQGGKQPLYLEPGQMWESAEYAYSYGGENVAKLFFSGCPLNEYLAESCIPDAIDWWRQQGSPQSP